MGLQVGELGVELREQLIEIRSRANHARRPRSKPPQSRRNLNGNTHETSEPEVRETASLVDSRWSSASDGCSGIRHDRLARMELRLAANDLNLAAHSCWLG